MTLQKAKPFDSRANVLRRALHPIYATVQPLSLHLPHDRPSWGRRTGRPCNLWATSYSEAEGSPNVRSVGFAWSRGMLGLGHHYLNNVLANEFGCELFALNPNRELACHASDSCILRGTAALQILPKLHLRLDRYSLPRRFRLQTSRATRAAFPRFGTFPWVLVGLAL